MCTPCRFVNYALQIVPVIILYYDYFLTLSAEIANYWPPRRPLTWLSGLFLATRYITLLGYIPVFVSMVWGTKDAVREARPISFVASVLNESSRGEHHMDSTPA